jgi:predicted TIM-barrel fold metal-dependent hydrolase
MIVDAHYHLDLRLESVDRLLAEMRTHRIDRVALIAALSEPVHVGPLGIKFGTAMRRALAGRAPWLGQLMYRTTVSRSGKFSYLGKGAPIYPRPDNDGVERTIAEHPDRFVGWFCVNPRAGIGAEEVERRLARPGWIGVKAHPFWHRYPVRDLDPVAEVCQARGKPMLIHLGAPGARGDFRRLPERFPRLRILYAHVVIPWYQRAWDDVRRRENVFVDLSAPYLDKALRYAALGALGPSRCVYGSDGPYGYPGPDGRYDHGAILKQIERFGMTAPELDRVLGGNFGALTGA